MNNHTAGMISPSHRLKGGPPTPQWFWWTPPVQQEGVEWGDRWTFGSIKAEMSPAGTSTPTSSAPLPAHLSNAVSDLYSY